MKRLLILALLGACYTLPDNGNLEEATVFHWENEQVTLPKFITDHKGCLGLKGRPQRNSMESLLYSTEPMTVPRWDSLWATFESRGYKEAGQRMSFSIPSGLGDPEINGYKTCMKDLGYRLTFMR
ncbi:MAG: hypothetical protein LBL52_03515 [Rickettsiales bacterium]|jgi:hypothetical protein|nr:hypothetical protein [Rickettsiales bacterium]